MPTDKLTTAMAALKSALQGVTSLQEVACKAMDPLSEGPSPAAYIVLAGLRRSGGDWWRVDVEIWTRVRQQTAEPHTDAAPLIAAMDNALAADALRPAVGGDVGQPEWELVRDFRETLGKTVGILGRIGLGLQGPLV